MEVNRYKEGTFITVIAGQQFIGHNIKTHTNSQFNISAIVLLSPIQVNVGQYMQWEIVMALEGDHLSPATPVLIHIIQIIYQLTPGG